MARQQGGAERAARVARRRLNPYVVEAAVAQNFAVRHAVERDASGEAQVRETRLRPERTGQAKRGLLDDGLRRGGEVAVAPRYGVVRLAGGPEQFLELGARHSQPGAVVEVVHIEAERAVRLEVYEVVEDGLRVGWLAVGREPHHFVLAGVDGEARLVGEGGVEQPERVGEVHLFHDVQVGAAPDRSGGGRPFADAVHCEDGGLAERRRIEGAGGV